MQITETGKRSKKSNSIGFIIIVMLAFLTACSAQPPDIVVNSARFYWNNLLTTEKWSMKPEDKDTPFTIIKAQKATLPLAVRAMASSSGYESEVWCLSFKPAIYRDPRYPIQNMLMVGKPDRSGKTTRWEDAGTAWVSRAQWISFLCLDKSEDKCYASSIVDFKSKPSLTMWPGVSEIMFKNAGCTIWQK